MLAFPVDAQPYGALEIESITMPATVTTRENCYVDNPPSYVAPRCFVHGDIIELRVVYSGIIVTVPATPPTVDLIVEVGHREGAPRLTQLAPVGASTTLSNGWELYTYRYAVREEDNDVDGIAVRGTVNDGFGELFAPVPVTPSIPINGYNNHSRFSLSGGMIEGTNIVFKIQSSLPHALVDPGDAFEYDVNHYLQINFGTRDGSARAGIDYEARNGTVIFKANNEACVHLHAGEVLDDSTIQDFDAACGDGVMTSGGGVEVTITVPIIPGAKRSEPGTMTLELNTRAGVHRTRLIYADSTRNTFGGSFRGSAGGITFNHYDSSSIGSTLPVNAAALSLSDAPSVTASEADGQIVLTVSASRAESAAMTVAYQTDDHQGESGLAAVGADYESTRGTLTIGPGETSGQITVVLIGDELSELNETFIVTLVGASASANALVSPDHGAVTITIVDDDAPILNFARDGNAQSAEFSGREGEDAVVEFTVELAPVSVESVISVRYRTSDGTAESGADDYTAASGEIIFNPNTATQTIAITIKDDDDYEGANETFTVTLHSPSGAELGATTTATGIIEEDDVEPARVELYTEVRFQSSLEDNPPRDITVNARFVDGDGTPSNVRLEHDVVLTVEVGEPGDSATGQLDYRQVDAFEIVIEAGSVTGEGTFELRLVDDEFAEDDETITLYATGYASGVLSAMLTIRDNDTAGMVFDSATGQGVNALSMIEGASIVYTARLSSRPMQDVTVTPTHGDEVSIEPATLTFTRRNWDAPRAVTMRGNEDDDYLDERITVVQSASGTEKYDALPGIEFIVAITDNDRAGVSINPDVVEVNEGETETYTVQLTSTPLSDVVMTLEPRGEITASPVVLTFTAENWRLPRTVTVTPFDDIDANDPSGVEIRHVLASQDVSYASGVDPDELSLPVTVRDDDRRTFVFTPASLEVTEQGGAGTYSVRLSTRPSGSVVVTANIPGGGKIGIVPGTLRFTESTWNVDQAFTVTGLADDDNLDESVAISHAVSGDRDYQSAALEFNVTVSVGDDDVPRLTSVGITDESLALTGRAYGIGDELQFEATFSGPVLVTGLPRLKFLIGDEERFAVYSPVISEERDDGEPGITRLIFSYTVQEDDRGPDGIEIAAEDLLNAGEGVTVIDALYPTVAARLGAQADFEDQITPSPSVPPIPVDGGDDLRLVAVADLLGEPLEQQDVTLDGRDTRSGELERATNLAYAWTPHEDNSLDVRLIDADKPVAIFNTTNIRLDTDLTFILMVTNTRTDDQSSDELTVTVVAVNDVPVANAGSAQRVDEGASVTLDGSDSHDPENESLDYSWRQTEGESVELADADTPRPSFEAPRDLARAAEELTFELTVTDPGGLSHRDVVVVTVRALGVNEVLGQAMARVGRALASSTVNAISERFSRVEASVGDAFGLSLNGVRVWDEDGMRLNALPGIAWGMRGGPIQAGRAAGADEHFAGRLRATSPSPRTRLTDISTFDVSAFELGFGAAEDTSPWLLWGRTEYRAFDGTPDQFLTLDGAVHSNHFGLDRRLGETGIVGLAFSSAEGTVDYENDGTTGEVLMRLTNINPYGRVALGDRIGVWGMYGSGSGRAEVIVAPHRVEAKGEQGEEAQDEQGEGAQDEQRDEQGDEQGGEQEGGTQTTASSEPVEINRTGTHQETEVSMRLLSAGTNADIGFFYGMEWVGVADILSVTMSSDESDLIADLDATSRRIRVGMEGGGWWYPWGMELQPSVGLSARYDSGDAESGFGMEMIGGITFIDEEIGLSVDLRLQGLVFHSDDNIKDWGSSLSVYMNPGGDDGFAFALSPSWGQTASRAQELWQAEYLSSMEFASTTPGLASLRPSRMNAELSYGFHGSRWGVSPYGALNTSRHAERLRLGLRLKALNMRSGKLFIDVFDEQETGPGLKGTVHRVLR